MLSNLLLLCLGKTVQAADPLHHNSKVYQANPSHINSAGFRDTMDKGRKQEKNPPVELPLPAPKYNDQMTGKTGMFSGGSGQYSRNPLGGGGGTSESSAGRSPMPGNTQESVEPEIPPGSKSS